jgi:ankyrin repeat protein
MKPYALLLTFCTLYAHKSSSMYDMFNFQALLSGYSRQLTSAATQIQQVLHNKTNLDAPLNTTSQFPALHEALDKVQLYNFVEPLLKAGANPNLSVESFLAAPLHRAVSNATSASEIKHILLLLKYGAQINSTNVYNQTPLMLAVKYGFYQATETLLQQKADPNIQDIQGNTALHDACDYQIGYQDKYILRENIIKLLLQYGADPSIKNNKDQTALDRAQSNGYTHLVKLMRNFLYSVN